MQPHDQPPPYSPPGHAQQYVPPGATVVTQQPVMVPMIVSRSVLNSQPTLLLCPSCNSQIITRVEMTPSVRTHIIAALLCLFIFWPCTCLPYCIGSCNNADHYCPNCNAYIGAYKF